MSKKLTENFLVFTLALIISGCSGAMRNYHNEMQNTLSHGLSGNIDTALSSLEKNNPGQNKDLLYHLEKAEFLQFKSAYAESLDERLHADEKIKIWEDESKLTGEKIANNASSLIVNDKVRRYDGRDYEKVMLSARLVSSRLLLGQWSEARIEVKKMHEREAIIAEVRAKEIEQSEKDASEKGINTTYKDLKGYPVEVLDDPEVEKLKNSYQNAYAHYLAGYIYESLGERSLAAAGYRKAIELRPNIDILEDALSGVDKRYKSLASNHSDVIIVYENGFAPSYKSMSIPIPLPGIGVTPISFPVIQEDSSDSYPLSIIDIDNTKIELRSVADIRLMAKRALKDEMPGIITRSIVRATSKAIAQKVANDHDSSGISGLVLMIGGLVVEGADERIWKTLPANISIARATLKKGKHTLRLPFETGLFEREVDINNRYTVIHIRKLGSNIYVAQAASPQELDDISLKEQANFKSEEIQLRNDPKSPSNQGNKKDKVKKKKNIDKIKKQTI